MLSKGEILWIIIYIFVNYMKYKNKQTKKKTVRIALESPPPQHTHAMIGLIMIKLDKQ